MKTAPVVTIVCAAILVGVAACAGGTQDLKEVKSVGECQSGPAWTCFVRGKCPVPELAGSLCAVGRFGPTASESMGIDQARNKAVTEMSFYVDSLAAGFARDVEDRTATTGTSEDVTAKSGTFAQTITQRALAGVAVPRTHVDRATGMYYALAALDAKDFKAALMGPTAGAQSAETRKEIERRADSVVDEFERERARVNP